MRNPPEVHYGQGRYSIARPGPLPVPPPFDPDPLLVDHLEGNTAERDRYRAEVVDMVDTTEAEGPMAEEANPSATPPQPPSKTPPTPPQFDPDPDLIEESFRVELPASEVRSRELLEAPGEESSGAGDPTDVLPARSLKQTYWTTAPQRRQDPN